MKVLKRTNRFYDTSRFGQPRIRVYHKKGFGKKMPRYLLKCGCCDEKVEIYHADDGLEINGVNGAIEDWREILLPLLLIEQDGDRFVDQRGSKAGTIDQQDAPDDPKTPNSPAADRFAHVPAGREAPPPRSHCSRTPSSRRPSPTAAPP